MFKKIALKIKNVLFSFKKKNASDPASAAVNALIDSLVSEVEEVAAAVDESVTVVTETVKKEAKEVTSVIEEKVPKKTASAKKPAAKKQTGTAKPKGRPKKSS
jgi:hypothetical protein